MDISATAASLADRASPQHCRSHREVDQHGRTIGAAN